MDAPSSRLSCTAILAYLAEQLECMCSLQLVGINIPLSFPVYALSFQDETLHCNFSVFELLLRMRSSYLVPSTDVEPSLAKVNPG